jgi:hypothetical protein
MELAPEEQIMWQSGIGEIVKTWKLKLRILLVLLKPACPRRSLLQTELGPCVWLNVHVLPLLHRAPTYS